MNNLSEKLLPDLIVDVLFELESRYSFRYKMMEITEISVEKSNLYFDVNSLYQKYELFLLKRMGDKLSILQSMFDYGSENVHRWLRALTVSREKATYAEVCSAINESDNTFVVDLLKNLRNAQDEELYRRRLCSRDVFREKKSKTSEIFSRAVLMNFVEKDK